MTIPGSGDPHTDQFSIRRAREEVGSNRQLRFLNGLKRTRVFGLATL